MLSLCQASLQPKQEQSRERLYGVQPLPSTPLPPSPATSQALLTCWKELSGFDWGAPAEKKLCWTHLLTSLQIMMRTAPTPAWFSMTKTQGKRALSASAVVLGGAAAIGSWVFSETPGWRWSPAGPTTFGVGGRIFLRVPGVGLHSGQEAVSALFWRGCRMWFTGCYCPRGAGWWFSTGIAWLPNSP